MTKTLISSGSPFEAQIAYSRAVVDGEWIFVSGTTGFDYSTKACQSTRHGYGVPTAAGTYRRIDHALRLGFRYEFP